MACCLIFTQTGSSEVQEILTGNEHDWSIFKPGLVKFAKDSGVDQLAILDLVSDILGGCRPQFEVVSEQSFLLFIQGVLVIIFLLLVGRHLCIQIHLLLDHQLKYLGLAQDSVLPSLQSSCVFRHCRIKYNSHF
jgi:hypothetical protein